MEERIDLIVHEDKRRAGGVGLAVIVSAVLHGVILYFFISTYRPAQQAAAPTPMTRYVELIKQNPSEFVEAPGQKLDKPTSLNAPLSDANRKAAIPNPTGDQPTLRPGDGGGLYQPKPNPLPRGEQQQQAAPQMAQAQPQQQTNSGGEQQSSQAQPSTDEFVYRENLTKASAAATGINWNSAIKEVSKIASLGGGDGIDLGPITGGEKGTAEAGPLSFETQWYDWGEYAQSMVSRIRVNWYANMPPIIRTGIAGVVTIRFTIHRDGRISNVTVLNSSTVPPYDFAARKAIELSSPLNPLPKDFPNATERVTAMFYYNKRIN